MLLLTENNLRLRSASLFVLSDIRDNTNNCAEQCFRLLGLRRHVGFFQTLEGCEYFCAIWSYLSTARKHKISYYDAAVAAFNGTAMQLLFPNGVPGEPASASVESTGAPGESTATPKDAA